MEVSDAEYAAHMEDFNQELLSLLLKYAPILGPQNGDAGVEVNDRLTTPTDVALLVNWLDMDTNNSFFNMFVPTRSNECTIIGMVWKAGNCFE